MSIADEASAGDQIVGALTRALNAAVDVQVFKKTGVKTGVFVGNSQTPTATWSTAPAGVSMQSHPSQWVPLALLGAALVFVLVKLASK